ncbi:hypothetical protein Dimus_000388, partial [Dionaea muscipula]
MSWLAIRMIRIGLNAPVTAAKPYASDRQRIVMTTAKPHSSGPKVHGFRLKNAMIDQQ